jgi:acetyl/propionyl-CoA carboxylase alpha subunit
MFKKILIANRGEIAVRIIRSCREMGISTVAVFSTADRTAPHVLMADEAYEIGAPPADESYLNIPNLLKVAHDSKSDGIHPGGWSGPPPEALAQMGDKMTARKLAEDADVPMVPGGLDPVATIDGARVIANELGYPVLIKAAGGGGGKGMRIVDGDDQLTEAFERASSEAAKSFADDRVYVEKLIVGPHHVEVQVFADTHGNVVTLGERECSIQRRYQKVIEETPSPFISEQTRQRLYDLARKITEICNYVGAGTVEFLVDKDQNCYFLEMNTRLQVEHPITEMVTGFDLVAEQIRVAAGAKLSMGQVDINPQGSAIECRIYAEDGFSGFIPSTGTILELTTPGGFGVRLDHGIRAGMEITPYYDPLLGKLCCWGSDRPAALARMSRALEELRIIGLRTTIPFCLAVLTHKDFVAGHYDTSFIGEHGQALAHYQRQSQNELEEAAAISTVLFADGNHGVAATRQVSPAGESQWLRQGRRKQLS